MKTMNEDYSRWVPQPPDLSEVELTPQLEQLCEQLAKGIHDIWAQTRIRDGWSYGPNRNDELKQTPCLVPYEALPEEEQFYDRIIAERTLRMILKFGYEIRSPRADSDRQPD